MPTSTNVTNLKINTLTEAQYDTAVSGGVIGANELSILTDVDEAIQVSTMPTAGADELGKVYQFIGTTDANYTHGYFYECVSDGATPAVYSWTAIEVQAGGGLQNTATGTNSLTILGTPSTGSNAINVGVGSSTAVGSAIAIGTDTYASNRCVALGHRTRAENGIAIGANMKCAASGSVLIGTAVDFAQKTNSTNNTFKWANNNDMYELFSADGTVPADRLVHAINKYSTMPTASSTNEGWIVQFTGTTDSTYTHGHLYECVSDGGNPATYSWTEVSMGGGGIQNTATGANAVGILATASSASNLILIGNGATYTGSSSDADATIAIGKGARTSGGISIGRNTQNNGSGVVIGAGAQAGSTGRVAIGYSANASGAEGVAIGESAVASATYAIQLGKGTNSTQKTFQVWEHTLLNKDDGTIPTARLTKVNSTITLTSAGWSSNTQTVTVNGVTSTSVVLVSPDPTDQSAYTSAGILCTAQGTDSLTFTCTSTPSADLTVNVVCL